MTRKNRIMAILLFSAVLFVIVFSAFFVAVQAEHNCVGEDCLICAQIDICQNTVKLMGFSAVLVILLLCLNYAEALFSGGKKASVNSDSLVDLKVKLSN